MSERPIFSVTNRHTDACGTPPAVDDSEPNRYLGYFQNEHGEQAIFVYDRIDVVGSPRLTVAGRIAPEPPRTDASARWPWPAHAFSSQAKRHAARRGFGPQGPRSSLTATTTSPPGRAGTSRARSLSTRGLLG